MNGSEKSRSVFENASQRKKYDLGSVGRNIECIQQDSIQMGNGK